MTSFHDHWLEYRGKVLRRATDPAYIRSTQIAFYSGAAALADHVVAITASNRSPAAVNRALEDFAKEMHAFEQSLMAEAGLT